jgi:hypothetical protein
MVGPDKIFIEIKNSSISFQSVTGHHPCPL